MTIDEEATSKEFRQVEPIPRGPAIFKNGTYYGGRPRCPVCLKWKRVNHNGHSLVHHHGASLSGFHCNKCKVWWRDSDYALCFVCDTEFLIPKAPLIQYEYVYDKEGYTSCYHHNSINFPFCPRCQEIIGNDRTSNRSGLRKLVGE